MIAYLRSSTVRTEVLQYSQIQGQICARLGIYVPVSQGNLISRTLHDIMLVGQSLRIECEHCGHEAGSKTHTADDIKAVAPNTNTTSSFASPPFYTLKRTLRNLSLDRRGRGMSVSLSTTAISSSPPSKAKGSTGRKNLRLRHLILPFDSST